MARWILFLAAALAAGGAGAHETWILPASGTTKTAHGWMPLAISSGMDFPKPDTALPPERVAGGGVRLGGATRPLQAIRVAGGALLARAELSQPGLATIWMEIPPLDVELTPAQVNAYFEEINADAAIRNVWDANAGKPWRERYAKFAKVFVGVDDFAADSSWSEPIGGALEIVPETHPKQLRDRRVLAVRVLKTGKPLGELPIAVQSGGVRDWRRTDAAGRVSFELQGPGPWLVHGTQLVPPTGPNEPWESWFTTLTIARP